MPSYAIFGASRGIGLEIVKQLSASKENTVFAIVRNPDTSTHLNDFIENGKVANVHIIKGDGASSSTIESAAKDIAAQTGGSLDVFVYNAFGGEMGLPLLSYTSQEALKSDFEGAFEGNFYSPINAATVFLPLLRKGNLKKLVAISTGLADLDFTNSSGFPYLSAYAISKAALNLAWSKIAQEVKGDGVICFTISPGMVDTSSTKSGPPPTEAEMAFFMSMVQTFQKIKPSFQGPVPVDTSVKMVLDVIEKAKIEDTGKLLSQYGNTTDFL